MVVSKNKAGLGWLMANIDGLSGPQLSRLTIVSY